jgi:hypothetical protein
MLSLLFAADFCEGKWATPQIFFQIFFPSKSFSMDKVNFYIDQLDKGTASIHQRNAI